MESADLAAINLRKAALTDRRRSASADSRSKFRIVTIYLGGYGLVRIEASRGFCTIQAGCDVPGTAGTMGGPLAEVQSRATFQDI
jgi:hypothetical protein